MLHPIALKVLVHLVCWNKLQTYYPKSMSKVLHMEVDEIELGIQSLLDHKLLTVSNVDGKWQIAVNSDEVMRYVKVPMEKVCEHDGFKLPNAVTWTMDKPNGKFEDIEGLSVDEINRLILRLKASLHEREEIKKRVVYANARASDDLPY